MPRIKTVVIGLGPIGRSTARLVKLDPCMCLTGLVDKDAKLVGTTPVENGPEVTPDAIAAIEAADVALICTSSRFADTLPLLQAACAAKTHVISSCEEMIWPRYRHPTLADELDEAAKSAGVTLLGAGVNPGFVMDLLPLVASYALPEVSNVRVLRQVDAGRRRKPLQAKVGAGLTVDQFEHRRDLGTIGHKGIAESVAMVVSGLGGEVEPGSVVETLEPILADRPLQGPAGPIAPGQVAGMRNTGVWEGDSLKVELDLIMSIGWEEEFDEVFLRGPVPLRLRIDGGTPGDSATAATLVNAARAVGRAQRGLRTLLDFGAIPSSRAVLPIEI